MPAIPLLTRLCNWAFTGDLKPGRGREALEQIAERQGLNPPVTHGRPTEIFPGLEMLVGFLNGKIQFLKQQGFLSPALPEEGREGKQGSKKVKWEKWDQLDKPGEWKVPCPWQEVEVDEF